MVWSAQIEKKDKMEKIQLKNTSIQGSKNLVVSFNLWKMFEEFTFSKSIDLRAESMDFTTLDIELVT